MAARASSIIWIMVGASMRSVTFSSITVLSATSPEKAGSTTCTPPETIRPYIAEKSARWNIGMACMNTAPAPKKPLASEVTEANARLFWLIITPLGKPVVPPV
ncbi:hypothetical protein D9M71_602530 [compost metagenome]